MFKITLPVSKHELEFRKPCGMDERLLLESQPEEFRAPMKIYEALAYACILSLNGEEILEANWKKRADLFEELKDKQYYENLFVEMFTLQREDMPSLQAQAKKLLASSEKAS